MASLKRKRHFAPDKKIILIILFILVVALIVYKESKETDTKDAPKYNFHEHIESFKQASTLLDAMDRAEIQKTVLLGSPRETIFSGRGFTNYRKNNEEILKIINKYPDRFIFLLQSVLRVIMWSIFLIL